MKRGSLVAVFALACACACENPGPNPLREPERTREFTYSDPELPDIGDRECRVVLRTVDRIDPTCSGGFCWMSWLVTFDAEQVQLADGLQPGLVYQSSLYPEDWWLTGAREVDGAGSGFQRFQVLVWKHTIESSHWEEHKDEFVLQLVPILTLPNGARLVDLNRDRSSYRHNPLDAENDWSLADHPLVCTGEDLWVLETVDEDPFESTWDISLAVDSRGRIHALFYGSDGLQYLVRDDTGWAPPVRVSDEDDPVWSYYQHELLLDSQGRPHLAYCWIDRNQGPRGPFYLSLEGQTWKREDLAASCDAADVSLALDSQDVPHLAWVDPIEGVFVSRRGIADWEPELVAAGEASRPALGFDAEDRARIVYFGNPSDPILKILDRMDDGSWVPGVEPEGIYLYRASSVAFDAKGRPHLGLFVSYGLGYARLEEQSWLLEDVDTSYHTGLGVSIAVYENGTGSLVPMMAYWDTATGGASFAWKKAGRWFHVVVDLEGIDSDATAVAVDLQGRPHILYKHWLDNTLKHAVYVGPTF